ncbi:MAG: magnesium transporter CorA family protein [Chloroflexota bacterium]|nr:magnesium transporter CorA family protein [Chloroflexota bacterium]
MAAEIQNTSDIHIETLNWGKITWINVENPSKQDMEYLAKTYLFHPLEIEDCLSRIERPKIDEHENYIFIVVHFPVFKKESHVTTPSQVSIFIAADLLVTVHTGELRPLANLFNDCQQNERARDENMSRSTGYLLYRILDRLVDYCFPITNKIMANVEEAEDRLFSDPARDSVREILLLRRDIMANRRIMRPQRSILKSLEIKDYPFLKEDLDVYFGDIGDHISKITETLDEYKEVVEGLNASSDSLYSHRTNQIMKMLTILATIMLPVLLVSGILGMNVYPMTTVGGPIALIAVILAMLMFSGILFVFFRFKKWF